MCKTCWTTHFQSQKPKHKSLTDWWVLWRRSCINLQYLSLAYCYRVSEKGLTYLNTGKGCRNLIHLDLSGCNQVGALLLRHSTQLQLQSRLRLLRVNPVSPLSLCFPSVLSCSWLSDWAQLQGRRGVRKAAREGFPFYTPTPLTMRTAPYHSTCAPQHTFLVLVGFQMYGFTLWGPWNNKKQVTSTSPVSPLPFCLPSRSQSAASNAFQMPVGRSERLWSMTCLHCQMSVSQ